MLLVPLISISGHMEISMHDDVEFYAAAVQTYAMPRIPMFMCVLLLINVA